MAPRIPTKERGNTGANINPYGIKRKNRGRKRAAKDRRRDNARARANARALANAGGPSRNTDAVIMGPWRLLTRHRFVVDPPYNKKAEDVFQTIPSMLYDSETTQYSFAIQDHSNLVSAMEPLRGTGVINSLPEWITDTFMAATPTIKVPEADLCRIGDKLNGALLPFQRKVVQFGIWKEGKVLIAENMGLARTIQGIGIAAYYYSEWPLLIVCRSPVRSIWADELLKWMPWIGRDAVVMVDTKTDVLSARVVIVSYDVMTKKKDQLGKCAFKVVILDDSHALKNPKTARTKAAQQVTQDSARVILLSGTPGFSHPYELLSQVGFVNRDLFPWDSVHYGIRYCNGRMTRHGMDFTGSSNLTELQLLLEETAMIKSSSTA